MNHIKLVEMMKDVTKEKFLTEQGHGFRYGRNIGGKTANLRNRYKPDKTPQLAEDDDACSDESKKGTGKTDTGKPCNKIITDPQYQSQMSPTQGPKPSIDSK